MKIKIILIVALLSITLVGMATATKKTQPAAPAPQASSTPDTPPAFTDTKDWQKLTDDFKQKWLDANKSGDMTGRVDCFIRVEPPADQGDRTFLESHGFTFITFAGNIARGYMPISNTQSVASLPFVQHVNCR